MNRAEMGRRAIRRIAESKAAPRAKQCCEHPIAEHNDMGCAVQVGRDDTNEAVYCKCMNKVHRDLDLVPKSKHTPGPWSTGAKGGIVQAGPITIAMVQGGYGKEEAAANARLIAAAPELAEALLAVLSELPTSRSASIVEAKAKDALRKAGVL